MLEEAELETYLHMWVPESFYFKEENEPKKASTSKGLAHVDFADDYKKPPNDSKKDPKKSKSKFDKLGDKGHLGRFGPKGLGGSLGSKRLTSLIGFPTRRELQNTHAKYDHPFSKNG